MILTDEQRKEIFDEGKKAAETGRSMRSCAYLRDATPSADICGWPANAS
jgi:hypothetical protein